MSQFLFQVTFVLKSCAKIEEWQQEMKSNVMFKLSLFTDCLAVLFPFPSHGLSPFPLHPEKALVPPRMRQIKAIKTAEKQ